MCLAIPGKVVETYREHDVLMGKVDFGGVAKRVCLDHVPEVQVGEYVLVHVGFALSRGRRSGGAAGLRLPAADERTGGIEGRDASARENATHEIPGRISRSRRRPRNCGRPSRRVTTRPWTIMEVCGGQTHTIVKYGIDELLPPEIELVHGPGCPVCVTPLEMIDQAHAIASRPGGDLLLVRRHAPRAGRRARSVRGQGRRRRRADRLFAARLP